MIISKIPETQGHYNVRQHTSSATVEAVTSKASETGKNTAGPHTSKDSNAQAAVNDRTTINRLDSQNAQRNQQAQRIRASDQQMEKVNARINDMKKELNVIVKNYPPFPPGSEERIARLRRFNSFRRQIEQLTIPPQKVGSQEKAGAPASPQVGIEQGSLVVESVEGDGFILSVRNTGTKAGQTKLTIPELSVDADDVAVESSLADLEKTTAALQEHRQALVQDAQQVNTGQEDSEIFFISESSAEESSYALRRDMAMITHVGFTKEPAQLVGFLN